MMGQIERERESADESVSWLGDGGDFVRLLLTLLADNTQVEGWLLRAFGQSASVKADKNKIGHIFQNSRDYSK
jgi:hypothetical protein